jgi:hypothetical protein
MRPEDPEMKTKRNDTGVNKQPNRCPVAAFNAEAAHKRKKALGVSVTP